MADESARTEQRGNMNRNCIFPPSHVGPSHVGKRTEFPATMFPCNPIHMIRSLVLIIALFLLMSCGSAPDMNERADAHCDLLTKQDYWYDCTDWDERGNGSYYMIQCEQESPSGFVGFEFSCIDPMIGYAAVGCYGDSLQEAKGNCEKKIRGDVRIIWPEELNEGESIKMLDGYSEECAVWADVERYSIEDLQGACERICSEIVRVEYTEAYLGGTFAPREYIEIPEASLVYGSAMNRIELGSMDESKARRVCMDEFCMTGRLGDITLEAKNWVVKECQEYHLVRKE